MTKLRKEERKLQQTRSEVASTVLALENARLALRTGHLALTQLRLCLRDTSDKLVDTLR